MATDIIRRPARPSPWRNPAIRGIVFQVLFVAAVLALGAFLVHNTVVNLRRQNIASGFGFLDHEAAFGIGESLIAYPQAGAGLCGDLPQHPAAVATVLLVGAAARGRAAATPGVAAAARCLRQQSGHRLCGAEPAPCT